MVCRVEYIFQVKLQGVPEPDPTISTVAAIRLALPAEETAPWAFRSEWLGYRLVLPPTVNDQLYVVPVHSFIAPLAVQVVDLAGDKQRLVAVSYDKVSSWRYSTDTICRSDWKARPTLRRIQMQTCVSSQE